MPLESALAVSAIAASAVWASGRYPLIALAIASTATILQPTLDITFEAMDLVIVFIAFQSVVNTSAPGWILGIVTFLTLSINDSWQRASAIGSSMGSAVVYPALLTGLSVGLGLQSRRVSKQNAQLRALQDADRQAAVSDERRRVARDLHDVAAHHLSALVVRNKLAQRLNTPVALRTAVDFSARTSAQTLTALRNVVHVLTTDSDSPRAPVPHLGHLDEIFDRVEAAGLVIEREIVDIGDIDEELEVALVRVIQEALANILQHRGPGNCWVVLSRDDSMVQITIDDDGAAPDIGGRPTSPIWPTPNGSGFGLVGMRERVSARGGRLSVTGSPRGGWRVSATFEVRAA